MKSEQYAEPSLGELTEEENGYVYFQQHTLQKIQCRF